MKQKLSVVILAAGEGTRMRSSRAKVLHSLAGKPLVRWVLSSVKGLRPDNVTFIVGHKAEAVREELAGEKASFALQKQQLGSGHALRQAAPELAKFRGDILVLCADTPLISTAALRSLLAAHRREGNAATILSAEFADPFGYGRIVRDSEGAVLGIVEEKDAAPEQRMVREINSGIYCFRSPLIWSVLAKIKPENRKNEYYLTDAIALLRDRGEKVGAASLGDPDEILGVNTRVDLSRAEKIVRERTLKALMLEGVTVIDPGTTFVAPGTTIGRDTVLLPGTIIEGATKIGSECRIGPYSVIKDSVIGNGVELRQSVVTEARIHDAAKIGPFSHLRPGTVLKAGARVGNFSEVKKSVIGEGAKVNHLSYIGDTAMGRKVNVGAGTITCNYDGVQKSRTVIGDNAFIGSNVNLVAPVNVGKNALLGAGSTITDNVPAGNLAIARARQINKQRGLRKKAGK
jgi:bifunctional UDP-N-acetylglucosamine pyrophosphorylase / glucosamine-1-phosphate N-acetyltransferase